MTDVSNLDDLANAISTQSANIRKYAQAQAAASQSQETDIQSRAKKSDLDALAARVAALENSTPPPDPEPEPVPGYGAKLPQAPSSLIANLTTVNVNISGSGDILLSGVGKRFVFPAGGVIQGRDVVLGTGLTNCRIDFNGCKSNGAPNGIRGQGQNANLSDLVIENFDIDLFGNQGLIGFGPATRVWVVNGRIAGGGTQAMVTHPERHGMYLGDGPSGHWRSCVIGNVKFQNLKNGYGLQAYSGYSGGGGLVDSVITGCTFDNVGAGTYPATVPGTSRSTDDVGICIILSGQSERVKIANCYALNSRRQLAAGGAGARVPCAEIITCAEVGRKGNWGGGQPGAIVGSPGSDPNIAGDPGYRLPWDTRTVGIGAF